MLTPRSLLDKGQEFVLDLSTANIASIIKEDGDTSKVFYHQSH